jgi:hypothetical protein
MANAPADWIIRAHHVGPAPRTGLQVSILGSDRYVRVLQRAFPTPVRWYGPFPSYDRRFDHVLYVQGGQEAGIRRFLDFCSETLLLPEPSTLDESWAMDMHWYQGERTELGQLVYRAKTYRGSPGEPEAAEELASRVVGRASAHPRIRGASRMIGVPALPPKAPHNLPELLADRLADRLGIVCDPTLLRKTAETPEVKNLPSEEKVGALQGAYEVMKTIQGETIIVVDDLLQSGATLSVIGNLLRASGASAIIGLVVTKTLSEGGP